jgi:2-polyprenyl-3-methyl-5-hydroxy-6-metoxy-1,4-benzoquinol methylase
MPDLSERVYANAGNPDVLALIDREAKLVLDVGCGAGDTAALLRARDPATRIFGITASPAEAARAACHMENCWVGDLEQDVPKPATARLYDVVVFSHVLEHLRNPARVVARFARLLRPGGVCVIAVPNVVEWRIRWSVLRGRFEYQNDGPLDVTHLRFFTFETAPRYLLAEAPELRLEHAQVSGSVPLWLLRRHMFPAALSRRIDRWGCRHWPNLFGGQILLRARRHPTGP